MVHSLLLALALTPAAPPPVQYEDFAELNFGGGVVSATGVAGKCGFTVVPVASANAKTTLSTSFAFKDEVGLTADDFQVEVVDAAGKRVKGKQSKASTGGNGVTIVTVVAEFAVGQNQIRTVVVQRRAKPAVALR